MKVSSLLAAGLLSVPLFAVAAPIEAIRLACGFDVAQLHAAVPALQAVDPAATLSLGPSMQALLARADVTVAHDGTFLMLLPLNVTTPASALIMRLKGSDEHASVPIVGELAETIRRYAQSSDFGEAVQSLAAVFDALRPPRVAAPSAPTSRTPMPFPSLTRMMAQSLGLRRTTRAPVKLLPPVKDPLSLPRGVLGTILAKMANRQNWGDVSYGASGIQTIEAKVRAQWAYEDSKADVTDLLAQLTPEQRRIADAAFQGGLAETPAFRLAPEDITLDWVRTHYPTTVLKIPGDRGRGS
jgi:hypothetical protein